MAHFCAHVYITTVTTAAGHTQAGGLGQGMLIGCVSGFCLLSSSGRTSPGFIASSEWRRRSNPITAACRQYHTMSLVELTGMHTDLLC